MLNEQIKTIQKKNKKVKYLDETLIVPLLQNQHEVLMSLRQIHSMEEEALKGDFMSGLKEEVRIEVP